MSPLKKPTFGLVESAVAFFGPSVERWRFKGVLEYALKLRPEFHQEVSRIRSGVNQVILAQRHPERNEDGSLNWSNRFAVAMELNQPIPRDAIFPEGSEGMSDDEILDQAHEFLSEYSVRWNFGRQTTAMDPNVLPEVIDRDIRDVALKINSLPFVRTGSSCSGHAESSSGFSSSTMHLNFDTLHADYETFVKLLDDFCEWYDQQDGIDLTVSHSGSIEGISSSGVHLSISAPKEWEENDLPEGTKTPIDNRAALLPDYYTADGFVNRDFDFEDPKNQRLKKVADEYNVEYYRRKNSFSHSDQCRRLRDQFWEGIGAIADSFVKSCRLGCWVW